MACHCTLLSLLAFAMPYLTVSGQEDEIQSLELFAGKQAISRQTQKFGFRAVALDKTYSDRPHHGPDYDGWFQACVVFGHAFRHSLHMLGGASLQ